MWRQRRGVEKEEGEKFGWEKTRGTRTTIGGWGECDCGHDYQGARQLMSLGLDGKDLDFPLEGDILRSQEGTEA